MASSCTSLYRSGTKWRRPARERHRNSVLRRHSSPLSASFAISSTPPLSFSLCVATAAIATLYACTLLFGIRALWRRWATSYSIIGIFLVFLVVGAARLVFLGWLNSVFRPQHVLFERTSAHRGRPTGRDLGGGGEHYHANRDRFVVARSEVLEDQARIELNAYHQTAFATVLAQGLSDAVSKRVSESVSHTRDLITDALPLEDSREALRNVAASYTEPRIGRGSSRAGPSRSSGTNSDRIAETCSQPSRRGHAPYLAGCHPGLEASRKGDEGDRSSPSTPPPSPPVPVVNPHR